MTNLALIATGTRGAKGIVGTVGTTKVPGTSVSYDCDGVSVATFAGAVAGTDYNLTVTVPAVGTVSPAAEVAKEGILKNLGVTGTTRSRIYSL